VHALQVNEPAIRLNFQVFTGNVECSAFAIRPLVANLATWSRLVDADRHRPTVGTEQPLLD